MAGSSTFFLGKSEERGNDRISKADIEPAKFKVFFLPNVIACESESRESPLKFPVSCVPEQCCVGPGTHIDRNRGSLLRKERTLPRTEGSWWARKTSRQMLKTAALHCGLALSRLICMTPHPPGELAHLGGGGQMLNFVTRSPDEQGSPVFPIGSFVHS